MSKVTNIFHVAGNYIAEQHIDIHDNNHCSIYATSAPEEERTPAEQTVPETEPKNENRLFCHITSQAYDEGKAQEVENELRSAASGSAKKLLQCIRMNEALGYIDTKNLSSQALYDELNACFGLKYTYQNFAKYRRD